MAIDSRIASCTVGDVRFERVPMRAFLPALTEALLAARDAPGGAAAAR